MAVLTKSKVPFTARSIEKCQCGNCPVQSRSACIKQLEGKLQESRKKVPLVREEIPGVYCASGKASCADLNPKNPCVCGTCAIFNEDYHLADNHPAGYFCKGGSAN